MSRRDRLLAALVAGIWGFNFVVISWGMHQVPPLLFAAMRFTAVLPMLCFVPRPAASWTTIAAVGAFMSLGQFGLLYSSMHAGLPPGLAALILQSQVIFTIAFAAAWLRERPTAGQLLGVGVGTLGLVVVGLGRGGHASGFAVLLCLAAALSWAVGNVVSRSSGVPGGLSLTVWSALVVPVPLLVLSLVLDGPHAVGAALVGLSWKSAVSTLYTAGMASVVGYTIFNNLLARNRPATVVPWVLLAPVVAMVSAWALLGQRPNHAEAAGGLLLACGVFATTSGRRGAPAPHRPRRAEEAVTA